MELGECLNGERLIHALSRTMNISMLNLISIEMEERKTWETSSLSL